LANKAERGASFLFVRVGILLKVFLFINYVYLIYYLNFEFFLVFCALTKVLCHIYSGGTKPCILLSLEEKGKGVR
jgi:hypothetical protein